MLLGSLSGTCFAPVLAGQENTGDPERAPKRWTTGETFHLKGYDVTLSAPVLVAESKTRHMSIPTIALLANDDLVVVMSNQPDVPVYPGRGLASFSSDGGLSWTEPVAFRYRGSVDLRLPSGDELMLPFVMALRPDGVISAPYNLIRKGERTLETRGAVEVAGWPELPGSGMVDGTLCGAFSFEGQTVRLKNGNHLATLYGWYRSGGIRIIGAESADGIHWKVVGTIARRSGKVNERGEGPTEAALCRLKDGRLMCIYRLDSNLTYGQTWSDDEGRTWSEPVECRGPRSVEPSLAVMKDGTVLLSGGRPGLRLWINRDGTGKDWQEVDIVKYRYKFVNNGDTTGYTELAVLDDSHLLYVYDYGFNPPGCRLEVVRITLERK
jgi:hypothetical protein